MQKVIKLKYGLGTECYVSGLRHVLCRVGTIRHFDIPYTASRIEMVLSSRKISQGYKARIGFRNESIIIALATGREDTVCTTDDMDSIMRAFVKASGKETFYIAINYYPE